MHAEPIPSPSENTEISSKRMKLECYDSENDRPAKSPSTEVPCLCNVNTDIWTRNILPFIGTNQYRFVGAVNRHFRSTYLAAFSSTITTFDHILGMEQAKLCHNEIKTFPQQLEMFWKVLAERGRQGILSYYYIDDAFLPTTALTAAAAQGGRFELLRWLVRQKCPVDQSTLAAAAIHGDRTMFQWLAALPELQPEYWYERTWDFHAVYNAALYGHLELLKWMAEEGDIAFDDTCSMAARNGHLHVLIFAQTKDCPWDESTCANAAMNGHLETLQWLRANDCPWDESTCLKAAEFGHVSVLQWALSNGCPVSAEICHYGAEHGF
jgi:hypothetical protein